MAKKTLLQKSEKTILKQINLDFKQAEDRMAQKLPDWKENYERYLALQGARTQEETGSQLCSLSIPKTAGKVDWWVAKMLQAIFNYRPITSIVSREVDHKLGADLLNEMCDFQMFNVPNVRRKLSDQLKDCAIRSTGILKTFWDKPNYQASFDSIPRENCYIDPYARYINEARFVIHKFYRTKEALEQSGLYEKERLKVFFKHAEGVKDETGQKIEQLASESQGIPSSEKGRYEIREYWTYDGLVTEGLHVFRQEEKTVEGAYILKKVLKPLKDSSGNAYLPFIAHTFEPKPHLFDGVSLVDQMKDLNDAYDTKMRQAIDATNFTINQQTLVKNSAFRPFTLDQMEMNIPGAVYEVQSSEPLGNVYQEIRKGDVKASLWQELGLLDNDMQNRTGIFDHAQGAQLSRQETATTTVSILQRADLKFSAGFESYAEETLKELTKRFIWLNQQFYNKPISTSKVVPDNMKGETIEYNADEIDGDYDIEINVSAIRGSNEMERAQLMQIIQLVMTSQAIQMQYPQLLQKLFVKLLSTMDMIKNAEEMFKQEEQSEQMNPMMQMMLQQQMGQGGKGGMGMPTGGGAPTPGKPTMPTLGGMR